MTPQIQPLSYRHRNFFFITLLLIFLVSLPFLFLYATGYRVNIWQNTLVSTGGLYIAAERTGAEIYIDNELVRETRVFRRAFYAQGLEEGTHRVHVQKEGHHTWVKELPVYAHKVTESQAFNLPLVPDVRVISPWQTTAGVAVLTSTSSVLTVANNINNYLIEPRASTSTLVQNTEFSSLINLFIENAEEANPQQSMVDQAVSTVVGITDNSTKQATTTKEWRGVRLYEEEGDIYATFVGPASQMPYYYCAETFPPYNPTSTSTTQKNMLGDVAEASDIGDELMIDLMTVSVDEPCEPIIRIDRSNQEVTYFDFFPNSTDLVLLAQEGGVYVVEIDDRSWQNRQALILGAELEVRVHNGSIYIYDGTYIYQVVIEQNWF